MRRISKDERFASRAARGQGDAPPILTLEDQMGPVTLELSRPIEVDGVSTTEIEIIAPTVDDILDAQSGDGTTKEARIRNLVRATGIPPEPLKSLHGRDFTRLLDIYWAFTE